MGFAQPDMVRMTAARLGLQNTNAVNTVKLQWLHVHGWIDHNACHIASTHFCRCTLHLLSVSIAVVSGGLSLVGQIN